MIVSLDTNIFILGLQRVVPSCFEIIRKLERFKESILIASMVEKEVVRNLSDNERKEFYRILAKLNFPIDYENPPRELVIKYKNLGLKKGDAVIGAFCEFRKIDYFISENRHFISELQTDKFKILDSQQFLKRLEEFAKDLESRGKI